MHGSIKKTNPSLKGVAWLEIGIITSLILMGCNVFRETLGLEAETPDAHILEGNLRLQKADYAGALVEFETAIKQDSTKSEAFFGGAKAALLIRHINMFQLMQSFQKNDPGKIPFLGEPDSVKDRIYTANRAINQFLKPMVKRDALHLLDGKVTAAAVSADYALATAIEAVLSLADFNGDGRIDSHDNILSGIIDLSDPTKLNPDSLMRHLADIKNDTAKITALNILLDKTQSLLAESGTAIDLFLNTALDKGDSAIGGVTCKADDSACIKAKGGLAGADREKVGDSTVTQVKQFLQNAGSAVVIYKVFDREDNDGDGCHDEELLDGIDNDGDGIVDEDSRGIPDSIANSRFNAEQDGADNDGDAKVDNAEESLFQKRYQASINPIALLTHPERKFQIFWNGDVDTRSKTFRIIDSTTKPPLIDTVKTFGLCHGPITGYKYQKANP
jgi:hypothetical protein